MIVQSCLTAGSLEGSLSKPTQWLSTQANVLKDPKTVAFVTERPRVVSATVQTQGANIARPDTDLAKKEHSKNIKKCSHFMHFSEDVKPF